MSNLNPEFQGSTCKSVGQWSGECGRYFGSSLKKSSIAPDATQRKIKNNQKVLIIRIIEDDISKAIPHQKSKMKSQPD